MLDHIFRTHFLYSAVTHALLSGPRYPIFSSWPRCLYKSSPFNGLIATPFITITSWLSTIFPYSIARKAHLDSPNAIPMLLENCVSKYSYCLRKFRLTAVSFKSSTKNKCFMGVSQFVTLLISLIKTTIDLLKDWTTILKDYHLGKYLKDSGLYLIGYLLHGWLTESLLTIFVSKFQWLTLQVVALLLILGQPEAICVVH